MTIAPQDATPSSAGRLLVYLADTDARLLQSLQTLTDAFPRLRILTPLPVSSLPIMLQGRCSQLTQSPQSTSTPGAEFFLALLGERDINENDLVLRLALPANTDASRVEIRVGLALLQGCCDPALVTGIMDAFSRTPGIGLAAPLGTSRLPVRKSCDAQVLLRLASALGIPPASFDEAEYFPHGLYFMSGRAAHQITTHCPAQPKQRQAYVNALEAGLTAFLGHHQLTVLNVSHRRGTLDEAVKSAFIEQMLALPNAAFTHPAHRGPAPIPPGKADALKYIAYYLPQFHAIPENDEWWGKGFTEWSNVSKAVPRFAGHYQPHLPADLGFYDLNRPEVLRAQIELAREHGIHGFCFYFYWFNGRTLLETPLRQFLQDASLDFPFCLCWANENWTRRWDGQENEVLMAQAHAPRDDLAFIRHITPYLSDSRYIRIDGKPVLLVYRATLLDDPAATAKRWRDELRHSGLGEIYLLAVNSFDITNPRPFGFDAAVEFPPHQQQCMPPITDQLALADSAYKGEVLDYRDVAWLAALDKLGDVPPPDYPVLRGVMAGWDNEARRPGRGRTYHHAAPEPYAAWLDVASNWTRQHNPASLQFVFINAWNEWAEGAHLEPDRRFGHAYLAATADVALRHTQYDATEAPVRSSSLQAVLNQLPAGLAASILGRAPARYQEQLAATGKTPGLRVVVITQDVDYALLRTLLSINEQSCHDFCVSLIGPEPCPPSWLRPDLPRLDNRVGEDRAQLLQTLAQEAGEDAFVLLHAGDRLLPNTLLRLQLLLSEQDGPVIISSDTLQATDNTPPSLQLYPHHDLERLRAAAPRAPILALSRSLLADAPTALDPAAGVVGEHDFLLRAVEAHGAAVLAHLQEILLCRPQAKALAEEALYRMGEATCAHLDRCVIPAQVSINDAGNALLIRYEPATQPLVSIIVASRDQQAALQRCIEGLLGNTEYPAFELILVHHQGQDSIASAFIQGLPALAPERIRCLDVEGPFNFAALCNLGARAARGEQLLFLNDDTAVLHPDWLDQLAAPLLQTDVGIVGPRLLFPDGRVQHAGLTLGIHGAADFNASGASMQDAGWQGELQYPRECSAVTGACLLVRRSLFESLSGFDEALDLGFADADLCLRAKAQGRRVLWTPMVSLLHEAGLSLKGLSGEEAQRAGERFEAARTYFKNKWRAQIPHDPWHHPLFALNQRQPVLEQEPVLLPWPQPRQALPHIFGLPADAAGSGLYRITQPLQQAASQALVTARTGIGYPLPVVLERLGIDTLFTQRQVDDDQLTTLTQLRRDSRIQVVMDFDDLLTAVPDGSIHKATVWKDIGKRVESACRLADRITVSTQPLAMALRGLHEDIRVVPNGIAPSLWQALADRPRLRPRGPRLRVGWAGGISHAPDLAIIAPVVEALSDEVDWIFLGMTLDTIKPHLTEFHPGVPLERYPTALADLELDLAIAPLQANAFNDCKSNLRLLEYGALGLPVLASDTIPYQCGLPVTLLSNQPKAWIKAIRERLHEKEALISEGLKLQQAVFDGWNIERQLPAWLAAWTGKS